MVYIGISYLWFILGYRMCDYIVYIGILFRWVSSGISYLRFVIP